MLTLPRPGVYAIRSEHAQRLAQTTVDTWLNAQEARTTPACLWLTSRSEADIHRALKLHLRLGGPHIKGLDVVSTRPLSTQGKNPSGIRQLCRALNSLIVLQPALVVIEHAELWFDHGHEPLEHRSTHAQMALLQRWAHYANAHIILPITNPLPAWCVFANGLADADPSGRITFSAWWPTPTGLTTALWNTPSPTPTPRIELHSTHFATRRDLAAHIHRLRYGSQHPVEIHLHVPHTLHQQDCAILLRLGADTLQFEHAAPSTHATHSGIEPLEHFAKDLHELFMPGQLNVLSASDFAAQSMMMRHFSAHWGLQCSLTRLPLLPHVTALAALRLINFDRASCMFTATHDSVYALKLWQHAPTENHIRQELAHSFHDQLQSLFSGDYHSTDPQEQHTLLHTLDQTPNPISMAQLHEEPRFEDPAQLTDVWPEYAPNTPTQRPWLARLNTLLQTKENNHA
jgi:hypothetical protein